MGGLIGDVGKLFGGSSAKTDRRIAQRFLTNSGTLPPYSAAGASRNPAHKHFRRQIAINRDVDCRLSAARRSKMTQHTGPKML